MAMWQTITMIFAGMILGTILLFLLIDWLEDVYWKKDSRMDVREVRPKKLRRKRKILL